MARHERAGTPATKSDLIDLSAVKADYYQSPCSLSEVAFGTSGHRGIASKGSFNQEHIYAITQATCDYRKDAGINGPVFIGADTHALSEFALEDALCILAANEVPVLYSQDFTYTATPLVSHAILNYNKDASELADGIIITPSHNPPECGGFKYNGSNGGPSSTEATKAIQERANEILENGLRDIKLVSFTQALEASHVKAFDFIDAYVQELAQIIDIEAIQKSGVRFAVDPLGGASLPIWQEIKKVFKLDIDIVNPEVDKSFSFMCLDNDGSIRMDCSSPDAMASLISKIGDYDFACGNDPDSDRHGIVTPDGGLMNPNHYLAVMAHYLFTERQAWPQDMKLGKTAVSSEIINRLGGLINREVKEVPVGFKWFVDDIFSGSVAFAGEESAGASFLRLNGEAWSTDKDGIIPCLLAAEIIAKTKKSPSAIYLELTAQLGGAPVYQRIDAPANKAQKAKLAALKPEDIKVTEAGGHPIQTKFSHAPGNKAALGGIKIVTEFGWFAARPSGTEDVYKIYAESFLGEDHLKQLQADAKTIVDQALS